MGCWGFIGTSVKIGKRLPFLPFRWSAIVDCDLVEESVLFFPFGWLLSCSIVNGRYSIWMIGDFLLVWRHGGMVSFVSCFLFEFSMLSHASFSWSKGFLWFSLRNGLYQYHWWVWQWDWASILSFLVVVVHWEHGGWSVSFGILPMASDFFLFLPSQWH